MKPQDKKARRKKIAKKHLEQRKNLMEASKKEHELIARRQLYGDTMRTPPPTVLAKQVHEHRKNLKAAKAQAQDFFSGVTLKSDNQGELSI